MFEDNRRLSAKGTFVCGLFAAGMGAFILLAGLGVLPMKPRSGDAPLWVLAVVGLAFFLAGTSVVVGVLQGVPQVGELPENTNWWMRVFYYVVGLVVVGALASIGSWVAFGPGERAFSGSGLFLLSKGANNIFGRVVFGFGAVLTWLCFLVVAIQGGRKLFLRGKPIGAGQFEE